jgi:uncharacterized protein (TIGR02996 family)
MAAHQGSRHGDIGETFSSPAAQKLHLPISPPEQAIRQQRASLIAAIRAHPSNDQIRLDYAALLEKAPLCTSDKARASLIRLQVERGTGPETDQEREIIRKHGTTWESAIAPADEARWDRGFIVAASVRASDFSARPGCISSEPIQTLRVSIYPRPEAFEDPMWGVHGMIQSPIFKANVVRLEIFSGGAPVLYTILKEMGGPRVTDSTPALREVHFHRFTDSRECALPSGNKYRDEMNGTHSVAARADRLDVITFNGIVVSGIPQL